MTAAVVYDDHLLFAEAFAQVLQDEGARAVATASVLRTLDIAVRGPVTDVVLGVDPGAVLGGDLIRRLRRQRPELRIVCISPRAPALPPMASPEGADLVLSKHLPLPELVRCVLGAASADRDVGVRNAPRPYRPYRARPAQALSAHQFAAQFLTRREREVLHLLVNGEPTNGIAVSLGISAATARGYIQSTFTKLGVHSRFEVIALVLQHGLPPDAVAG
jgi:DNA-binding NarL/FixJ family response regulator